MTSFRKYCRSSTTVQSRPYRCETDSISRKCCSYGSPGRLEELSLFQTMNPVGTLRCRASGGSVVRTEHANEYAELDDQTKGGSGRVHPIQSYRVVPSEDEPGRRFSRHCRFRPFRGLVRDQKIISLMGLQPNITKPVTFSATLS